MNLTGINTKIGDGVLSIAVGPNLSELIHCELSAKVADEKKELVINAPSKAIAWMIWNQWEKLEELLVSHPFGRVSIQACGHRIVPVLELEKVSSYLPAA